MAVAGKHYVINPHDDNGISNFKSDLTNGDTAIYIRFKKGR